MKQPKKLTLKNKKLLADVGLNPMEWMNYFEDYVYLHVIRKTDTVQVEISEVIDKIYYENGKTEFAKNIALAVLNEIERLCKVKGSK